MPKKDPKREDFELNPDQHPDLPPPLNDPEENPQPDGAPNGPAQTPDSLTNAPFDAPETEESDEDAPRRKRGLKLPKSSHRPRTSLFARILRRFGFSPNYDPLVRTADEVKRYGVVHKILVTLLGTLVTATAITYVVAILYSKYGSLTVSINKYDSVNYCLTLSEEAIFENQISRLNAKAAEDITNISVNDLPGDLDNINGEHNGANYLAYTFYVKNVGHDTVNYEYNMFITNVKNRVDEAIRIRIYKDGVPTDYARTRSDGRGAEPNTTEFLSSRTITRTRVDNFGPGDVNKFTVVIWLEGNDPDCVDELIDGALKSDMIISVVEARQEEVTSNGSSGSGTVNGSNGANGSGTASASEMSALLAGDWYAFMDAVDSSEFLTFTFSGSTLKRANYDCDVLTAAQDDHDGNNIYYNGGIYLIRGGVSRRGSYTLTMQSGNTFRVDASYPVDAQYPEAETASYVFALSPDSPDRLQLRTINGQEAGYNYVRGDVDDLRLYMPQ